MNNGTDLQNFTATRHAASVRLGGDVYFWAAA